MKRTVLVPLITVLVIASSFGVNKANGDSPWGYYAGDASRAEERLFIDNLGFYLQSNPEMIGYIAYFSDRKQSESKLKARVERAVRYIVKEFKIERNRLRVNYGGVKEKSKVVLQPLSKDVNPPF